MIDDDHLDPALVDRFRALTDVDVPDTWSHDGSVAIRHEATASSRRWLMTTAAVAAVALLVIAGIALASRNDDGVVVGPVVTDVPSTVAPATAEPSSPASPAPTAAPTTVVVAPSLASADPQTGRPGDLIVLTPNGVTDRECGDIVTVSTADGESVVGQLFTDGSWFPIPEGASPTYPACYQPPSDAPLTLTLPRLDAGVYRFCLDWAGGRDICALVGVEGDGPASVEPSGPVTPGQTITITPAGAVERICTDIVQVWSGDELVGQILDDGRWGTSGLDLEVPTCLPPPSAAPLTVTVPPIASGTYDFCLSLEPTPGACGAVAGANEVATAEPAAAAPGQRITITPAGVVPRICTDIVQIVRDGVVVGQVWDVATGTWEGPSDDGTFDVPGCAPAPSADPLDVVVPDIPTGTYELCLSPELLPASCARVTVG